MRVGSAVMFRIEVVALGMVVLLASCSRDGADTSHPNKEAGMTTTQGDAGRRFSAAEIIAASQLGRDLTSTNAQEIQYAADYLAASSTVRMWAPTSETPAVGKQLLELVARSSPKRAVQLVQNYPLWRSEDVAGMSKSDDSSPENRVEQEGGAKERKKNNSQP